MGSRFWECSWCCKEMCIHKECNICRDIKMMCCNMDNNTGTIFKFWSTPKTHTWQLVQTIFHEWERSWTKQVENVESHYPVLRMTCGWSNNRLWELCHPKILKVCEHWSIRSELYQLEDDVSAQWHHFVAMCADNSTDVWCHEKLMSWI